MDRKCRSKVAADSTDVITTRPILSTRAGARRSANFATIRGVLNECLAAPQTGTSCPLWLVTEAGLPQWLEQQPEAVAAWVRANGFQAERARVLAIPGAHGSIAAGLVGLGPLPQIQDIKLWHSAGLSERLPAQTYHLATALPPQAATHFALGWLVGAYRLGRYRTPAPVAHSGRGPVASNRSGMRNES